VAALLERVQLDPASDYRTTVLDRSRVKDLQAEHQDLVDIARAEMDSLYDQISGSGYALLLADTDGVILCEKVDPNLKGMFTHAGLIVGAEWSEQREGTNGIGTCAKEARPITIHQSDHFRSRHVGLSCSAAPIRDSSGRVVAVLDASSVNAHGSRDSKMHTVALVETSARLIEKCLFLRRHRADAMLRFHYRPEFVDLLHDGAIAVAVDGTIVASDATGLKLLGAATGANWWDARSPTCSMRATTSWLPGYARTAHHAGIARQSVRPPLLRKPGRSRSEHVAPARRRCASRPHRRPRRSRRRCRSDGPGGPGRR